MHDLDGRIPLLPEGKTLVSAHTYNRLAQVLRNICSESLQIGVAPNGGLRLEIDSQPLGEGGGDGAVSGYAGPFALTDEGVSAGRIVLQNANGLELMTYDVPSWSYGTSTGYVSMIVTYNPTTKSLTHYYQVSAQIPDATGGSFGVSGWLFLIGYLDGNSRTQYQYGDIYAWYSGNTYAGPFAFVPAGNVCYIEPGIVFCGTTTLTTNRNQVSFTPSTSLYVLLTITYTNSSYHATILSSSTYTPSQSASSYIVPLGRVHDGIIEQWQHGPVYMAGRVA